VPRGGFKINLQRQSQSLLLLAALLSLLPLRLVHLVLVVLPALRQVLERHKGYLQSRLPRLKKPCWWTRPNLLAVCVHSKV
jgi:type IV secretory pathway protease TraF